MPFYPYGQLEDTDPINYIAVQHCISTVTQYLAPLHRQARFPEFAQQSLPIVDLFVGELVILSMATDMQKHEVKNIFAVAKGLIK